VPYHVARSRFEICEVLSQIKKPTNAHGICKICEICKIFFLLLSEHNSKNSSEIMKTFLPVKPCLLVANCPVFKVCIYV
jgi:hypothetical protein